MEEMKITPTNTMEKGARMVDSDNIMEFFRQQMYKNDLSDRNVEEMLEVAYRFGYKSGHDDTTKECYTPLWACVVEEEDGELSLELDSDFDSCEEYEE